MRSKHNLIIVIIFIIIFILACVFIYVPVMDECTSEGHSWMYCYQLLFSPRGGN